MSESAERIYALLVDANPVTDIDNLPEILAERPHLYVIDTRSDEMQTQTRPHIEEMPPVTPKRRRGWIPAVATAVVVLIAVGVGTWLFGATDTTTPPATEAPVVTTAAVVETTTAVEPTPEELAQVRIEVAQQAIADWAAGDVDAFFGHFGDGATVQGTSAADGSVRRDLAFYMGLGQVLEVTECSQTIDTVIRCTATTTDNLSRTLGAEAEVEWIIRVDDGSILSLDWSFPPSDLNPFDIIDDMVAWIATSHPDVFDAAFKATIERCDASDFNFYATWCASPLAAEEMLRLAPEFLAQAEY